MNLQRLLRKKKTIAIGGLVVVVIVGLVLRKPRMSEEKQERIEIAESLLGDWRQEEWSELDLIDVIWSESDSFFVDGIGRRKNSSSGRTELRQLSIKCVWQDDEWSIAMLQEGEYVSLLDWMKNYATSLLS